MIWFIIGLLVFLGVFGYFVVSNIKDFGWKYAFSNISVSGSLIIFMNSFLLSFLFSILTGSIFFSSLPKEEVLVETVSISAFSDSSVPGGKFFLGSGCSDDKIKYYYVTDTDKGKVVDNISSDKVFLVESDTDTPRIEKYSVELRDDWLYWFGLLLPTYEYRIYVPVGSVVTDFSVDLNK